MVVLKANTEQFNALNGYQNGVDRIEFALDGAGNYIAGLEILHYEPFAEIRDQLLELEQINYIPYDSE
jgi:hypothetical protein